MSSAVSARPPGGQHRDPELTPTKDQPKTGALGLTSATMLVIGTVIGAGVFTMPAVLASAGTISLAVLAVIAVGAMVLAILFGQLTRRVPNSDGGLYAYARYEFGDFAGYLTGWCYWIQAWAGNAAIVSSWVFYVDALFGIKPSATMLDAVRDADCIAVLALHREFEGIDFAALPVAASCVIVDGRAYYSKEKIAELTAQGYLYRGIGRRA